MLMNLFYLLVFAGDVWAIFNIFSSREKDGAKLIWALVVLLLPLLGLIAWYLKGPKK